MLQTKWVATVRSSAGDTIELQYTDWYGDYKQYNFDVTRLILNEREEFTSEWEINEILDKFLTDEEYYQLFMTANRKAA